MKNKLLNINILGVNYPNALPSALYGLSDMLELANQISLDQENNVKFETIILSPEEVIEYPQKFDVIFLPPSLDATYVHTPALSFIHWLKHQNQQGALLTSACAGSFLLAQTGLLNGRQATTHWGLADQLRSKFPNIQVTENKVLVDNGNTLIAGGMMSWMDLGLELIRRYISPRIMRDVGKALVIDTAERDQSFYQQFHPDLSHSDSNVIKAQQWIHQHYAEAISNQTLAALSHLSIRSLLRRFKAATHLTPAAYLKRFRMQQACNLLESTNKQIITIANEVGYSDLSAFRRAFHDTMGLAPIEFRKRFK